MITTKKLIWFMLSLSGTISCAVRVQKIIHPSIVDLAQVDRINNDIDQLFAGTINAIPYITSDEARQYFSEYVSKKYGETARDLMARYFTRNYFGKQKAEKESINYLIVFTALYNLMSPFLLDEKINKDQLSQRFATDSKRFPPEVIMMSPEDIFMQYLAKGSGWLPTKLKNEGLTTFAQFQKKYPIPADIMVSTFGFSKENLEKPFGLLSPELIRNIYSVAQRIMSHTKKGDYLIIFGNTPYFVGRALHNMISKNPQDDRFRKIINFPFSGSPNRPREGSFSWIENLVTKERLEHLKNRLKISGLNPSNADLANHNIYFIDVIGSGSGPAYTIQTMIHMFQEAKKPIPNINIIALNEINITDPEDRRNAEIAKQNAKDGQKLLFYFPSITNTEFEVDGEVLYLSDHSRLDFLPSRSWRMLPEYTAMYWLPEYDYLLTQDMNETQKAIMKYIDAYLEKLTKEK